MGLPLKAQQEKHLLAVQETRIPSLGREDLLEEEIAAHSCIVPEKSHGQRSLAGYSPMGCKELDMTEQLSREGLLCTLVSSKKLSYMYSIVLHSTYTGSYTDCH